MIIKKIQLNYKFYMKNKNKNLLEIGKEIETLQAKITNKTLTTRNRF